MGDRESYPPGTFSWVDLATTDVDDAKRFYGGLFGLEFEDRPTGNGAYSMARLHGKDVCALVGQGEEERGSSIPPHWNSYVTVEKAGASAKRAEALGGSVKVPAFDVVDVGRMAVIGDPTGAVLCVWEPKAHIGAGLVNEPGALCWNELSTDDVAKAKTFYTELFGWSTEDMGDGAYVVIRVGGKSNGGIRPQGEWEKGVAPNWLAYFAVTDCDESAARTSELGGSAIVPPTGVPAAADVPPMDAPAGEKNRFSVIADPQGAVFGIFAGPLDP